MHMAKSFDLVIMEPGKTLYEGAAVSLIVPSAMGYMGILADHAPIIANLVAGKITVRDDSGESRFFTTAQSGFLEVFRNKATLLVG